MSDNKTVYLCVRIHTQTGKVSGKLYVATDKPWRQTMTHHMVSTIVVEQSGESYDEAKANLLSWVSVVPGPIKDMVDTFGIEE